jgi:pyruvate formate lyase activating enzyme
VRRILIARRVFPRAGSASLRIGGFERLSLVDWPSQLAAVVFCQGCGWRCRYCHNPHLIPFPPSDRFAWENILAWLENRRGLLDAVVFSGGEPTLHPGLYVAMKEARALGFKIGLHTAGPVSANLSPLLPLLDWVGFDFKAPFSSYTRITGQAHGEQARTSFQLLRSAGVPCEVRTTWHPALLSTDDLAGMARSLAEAGCMEWVIQRFRPDGCTDEELRRTPIGDVPVEAIAVPGLNIIVR